MLEFPIFSVGMRHTMQEFQTTVDWVPAYSLAALGAGMTK